MHISNEFCTTCYISIVSLNDAFPTSLVSSKMQLPPFLRPSRLRAILNKGKDLVPKLLELIEWAEPFVSLKPELTAISLTASTTYLDRMHKDIHWLLVCAENLSNACDDVTNGLVAMHDTEYQSDG
jgi:hypothetical protein